MARFTAFHCKNCGIELSDREQGSSLYCRYACSQDFNIKKGKARNMVRGAKAFAAWIDVYSDLSEAAKAEIIKKLAEFEKDVLGGFD